MTTIDHNDLTVETEDRAAYTVQREVVPTADDDAIISRALAIIEARVKKADTVMTAPAVVRDWLRIRVGGKPHEEFGVAWLDAQHKLIEAGELFRGTLTQASVYPREVVKEALRCNAAAVILYHNHPSGSLEASSADQMLTRTLKDALALVDVRILDHFIVTPHATMSFAEKGLL